MSRRSQKQAFASTTSEQLEVRVPLNADLVGAMAAGTVTEMQVQESADESTLCELNEQVETLTSPTSAGADLRFAETDAVFAEANFGFNLSNLTSEPEATAHEDESETIDVPVDSIVGQDGDEVEYRDGGEVATGTLPEDGTCDSDHGTVEVDPDKDPGESPSGDGE